MDLTFPDRAVGFESIIATAANPLDGYVLYDTLTGTGELVDHVPEKGGPWTVNVAGTFTLSGGKATLHGGPLSEPRAYIDGGANGTITFELYYDSGLLVMKVFFNRLDDNNFWYIESNPILGGAPNTFILKEVTAGVETSRGNATFPAATSSCQITVVLNGDTVQATVGASSINYTSVGARPNKSAIGLEVSCFDNDADSTVSIGFISQTVP